MVHVAAKYGHRELVQWLCPWLCPWGAGTCYHAVKHGHVEVLRWVRARTAPRGTPTTGTGRPRSSGTPTMTSGTWSMITTTTEPENLKAPLPCVRAGALPGSSPPQRSRPSNTLPSTSQPERCSRGPPAAGARGLREGGASGGPGAGTPRPSPGFLPRAGRALRGPRGVGPPGGRPRAPQGRRAAGLRKPTAPACDTGSAPVPAPVGWSPRTSGSAWSASPRTRRSSVSAPAVVPRDTGGLGDPAPRPRGQAAGR